MTESQGLPAASPETRVVLPPTLEATQEATWLRWGAILLFIAAALGVVYTLSSVVFEAFGVGNLGPVGSFAVQVVFSLPEGFLGTGLLLAFLALERRWPSEERYFTAAALTAVIGGVGAAFLRGYLFYSIFFVGFNGGFIAYVQTYSNLGAMFASLIPISLGIGFLGLLRMRPLSRPD